MKPGQISDTTARGAIQLGKPESDRLFRCGLLRCTNQFCKVDYIHGEASYKQRMLCDVCRTHLIKVETHWHLTG